MNKEPKKVLITIGIDPGQKGAISVLADGQFLEVHSMPLEAKRTGSQIDCSALVILATGIKQRYCTGYHGVTPRVIMIALEQASANPMQGVSSMFSFGDAFGCARFFAALIGEPMVLVHPAKWKRAMGMTKPVSKKHRKGTKVSRAEKNKRYKEAKQFAITKAKRLFPAAREHLSQSKDEGRAESLLLARYANDFQIA